MGPSWEQLGLTVTTTSPFQAHASTLAPAPVSAFTNKAGKEMEILFSHRWY